MKRKYYIITGTSRGIGEALAVKFLSKDSVVFCISRNQNPRLSVEAHVKGFEMQDVAVDLNETGKINEMVHNIFRGIDPENVSEINLINNAGTIHPIRMVGEVDAAERIIRSVNVNLVAAMLITDRFVRETEGWDVARRVVNISSGAAKNAVEGWSAYCSAKAGLEMYGRCLNAEQAKHANPVKLVSFAPGVVNTEMQEEIRNTDEAQFPQLDRFVGLKESGSLLEPEFVAEKIKSLLDSSNFGETPILHISDMA